MDVIRQDTRQFIHSVVFHCKGDRFAVFIEGKKLFDGFKLSGSIDSEDFKVVYHSNLLEEIDSDYDAHKYDVICSLKQKFKNAKLKQSFECITQNGNISFVEIYYLKVTCKVLIKVSESAKEEIIKQQSNKLISITKPKIMDENEPNSRIVQLITLSFSEINHPDEELTEDQIRKFIKMLTFSKLKLTGKFFVDPITQHDFQQIVGLPIGSAKKQKNWSEEILSTEMSPRVKAAFSDLNHELVSNEEDKDKKLESNNKPLEDEEKTSMLPSLKWEFNLNVSSPNHDVDEEHEVLTHHASTIRNNVVIDGEGDLLDHSLDIIKKEPGRLLELKKLKSRLSLKPIMFALYTFNSLRRKQKRLTTPVMSVKKTDEVDSVVIPGEKDPKVQVKSSIERMKTRLGGLDELIVSKNELEESHKTGGEERRSKAKFRTVISQAADASIVSNNPDLQLQDYQKSGRVLRDNLGFGKRANKIRRSTLIPRNSKIITKAESIEGLNDDKPTNTKDIKVLNQKKLLRKAGSAMTQNSNLDQQDSRINDLKLELGTLTSPGGDSLGPFFNMPSRNNLIRANDNPRHGLLKMQTVKKESSESIIELPDEPKSISKDPSFSIEEVEKAVPLLEPPIKVQRPDKRKSIGLKMLPKEDLHKSHQMKGQSNHKPININTISSDSED